jgi:hypothetical protein
MPEQMRLANVFCRLVEMAEAHGREPLEGANAESAFEAAQFTGGDFSNQRLTSVEEGTSS